MISPGEAGRTPWPPGDARGGAPQPSYRELLRETRKRRWLIRAVAAAVVGGVLWALLARWAGAAGAVVTVLADVVYRTKTLSSVPAWRKMGSSERRTERQLYRLEGRGYRTLHARAIPDSTAQIDHLVIGPTGVFAVDSEKWDRHLPVRAYPNRLFVGPFSRDERLQEARWEAERARELLSKELGHEVEVVPSLAIYGPTIPWKVLQVRGVDVFTGNRVRKWVRRRKRVLDPPEVERIASVAETVLPYNTTVEAPN